MAFETDITKLGWFDKTISNCEVVTIPAGATPKFIKVKLPSPEEPVIDAWWDGIPHLIVGSLVSIRRSPGNMAQYTVAGGGTGTATPADHSILSDEHADTLTASVVAGDIIIGNATPKWARLAKGTDGEVLTLVSGLPSWEAATGGGWKLDNLKTVSATNANADFTTITAAIASIATGGSITIALEPNVTYTENLTIDGKNVYIIGLGGIAKGEATGVTTIDGTITITGGAAWEVLLSNLRVTGLLSAEAGITGAFSGVLYLDHYQSKAVTTQRIAIVGTVYTTVIASDIQRTGGGTVIALDANSGSYVQRFRTTHINGNVTVATSTRIELDPASAGTTTFIVPTGSAIIDAAGGILNGKIWRVRPDGIRILEPAVSSAYTNAATGDIILCHPGTYRIDDFDFAKQITIRGTDRDSCILLNQDCVNPIVSSVAGTIFENLTITSDCDENLALKFTAAGQARNCKFIVNGGVGAVSYGVLVATTGIVQLYDCEIDGTSLATAKYGVGMTSAGTCNIYRGKIDGPTADVYGTAGTYNLFGPVLVNSLITHSGTLNGYYEQTDADVVFTAATTLQLVNPVDEFSADGTMAGNSDTALPTEKAVVTYTGYKFEKNLLYHAMHHNDWQEGTTFNDIADATTYVGNVWLGVQNGQAPDVAGLAGGATSDYLMACKTTMDSAASQNGFVQFFSNEDTIGLRGKTVSVSAELWGTNVANLAMNVLIWTSTADAPTKDVVATWNNGSAHALATNWAFGATSAAIAIGSSEGTRYKTQNIAIPTNANNIAVFISTWDNEASGDIWNFANAQLEIGAASTDFVRMLSADELLRVRHWLTKSYNIGDPAATSTNAGSVYGIAVSTAALVVMHSIFAKMRTTPVVTIYSRNGTLAKVSNIVNVDVGTTVTAGNLSDTHLNLLFDSGSGFTVSTIYRFHYVADARF